MVLQWLKEYIGEHFPNKKERKVQCIEGAHNSELETAFQSIKVKDWL